jgi:hypothetical protein
LPFLVGGFLQPGERFCRSWLLGFLQPGERIADGSAVAGYFLAAFSKKIRRRLLKKTAIFSRFWQS